MSVRINDVAPDFTADSTAGMIKFHDWIGDSYAIIFSHPRDFTPVCTTEFGAVAQLAPEFAKRKTKVMGVSVDSVEEHVKWKADIAAVAGARRAGVRDAGGGRAARGAGGPRPVSRRRCRLSSGRRRP